MPGENAEENRKWLEQGRALLQQGEYADAMELFLDHEEDADAAYYLGYLYDKALLVSENPARAAYWYQRAADAGSSEAANMLGVMNIVGRGTESSSVKGLMYLRRACEQGNENAFYNMGLMYEEGNCVREDLQEALFWYRKGAEKGHELSIRRLRALSQGQDGQPQKQGEGQRPK